MSNKLIIKFLGKDLTFNEPKVDERAYKGAVTQIKNAWKDSISVDEKGWLWVSEDKIHSILRTTKANGKFKLAQIEDKYKLQVNSKTYIRGFKVLSLIAQEIEESAVGTKEMYLNLSQSYYSEINMSDQVRLLRLEYDKNLSDQRKKLKNKRKRKYKIKLDELTGEPLDRKGSEFSHIRSFSQFKEIGDSIENGLLVNKGTHEIITARGVNTEDELYTLCEEMGWKIDWYDTFKANFEN